MIVIPPRFEHFFAKKKQTTCQKHCLSFITRLRFYLSSIQNSVEMQQVSWFDNMKENCMHVSAESMVIIWIKLTFADIFKFQIKKVFNDGKNDYAMSFNYMMLWKCYNMSYEFSISWLLCCFLAVLTTNEIKTQMRWFMELWNKIWIITLFCVS